MQFWEKIQNWLQRRKPLEPLLRDLKNPNRNIRRAAAVALRDRCDPRSASDLLIALNDDVWHVKEAAAEALGRLRYQPARERLTVLLEDENPDVRIAAQEALQMIDGI